MRTALAMPAVTMEEITARNRAISAARQTQLTRAANRPLSGPVVARVDSLLGLPPNDPAVGISYGW
ncbi:hypothetical protein GXW71_03080 [Roseomonas hellenica]|uniref:Uncharacterized protein n=3 Tax=Plastoroseomonas hellenica TaxID=2687306 RepID=A0ABS5ESR5_9PROT|nr:hypothetical protein [Plastoroseomonas hellenica]